jgi:hypothetical protein
MARFVVVSMLLSALCFSTGCAYWYQEGKSFEECDQDLQLCYDELQEYADMNSIGSYEVDFVKDCMQEKGYKLLFEDDLPKVAKRRDPQMKRFWVLAGVSGTVE